MAREVTVTAYWKSAHTLEVPEGMNRETFIEHINSGAGPIAEEAMDKVTSANAELTDWEIE